ncbi:MAG: SMP-30/gluconolactonase/LRE family protein [Proteobacteria bacterium]|nr:SMP-30/gluconolactonase/LRE family protein [Pseudomonadota bacterium]
MSVAVVCLAQTDNLCGESPVWDPREQALYWVDIYRPTLWRYDPATRQTRAKPLARLVGSIGLRAAGGLIAATSEGFATLSPDTGELTALPRHAPDAPRYRFNDGKCDRAGRFWAGTVDTTNYAPVGELFRLDPDGSTHFCASDLVTPNGMAFAPDDRTMYLADSRREIVYAYEFEGRRYDCGSKLGYLQATVEYALKHASLGEKFSDYLLNLAANLPAGK